MNGEEKLDANEIIGSNFEKTANARREAFMLRRKKEGNYKEKEERQKDDKIVAERKRLIRFSED
jgi:hypothetical protein